jgi:hypothetical protein
MGGPISGTINNFGVSSVYCGKRNKKLVPFPQYTEETPKLFIVPCQFQWILDFQAS